MPDLIGHLITKYLRRHPFEDVSFFVIPSNMSLVLENAPCSKVVAQIEQIVPQFYRFSQICPVSATAVTLFSQNLPQLSARRAHSATCF